MCPLPILDPGRPSKYTATIMPSHGCTHIFQTFGYYACTSLGGCVPCVNNDVRTEEYNNAHKSLL